MGKDVGEHVSCLVCGIVLEIILNTQVKVGNTSQYCQNPNSNPVHLIYKSHELPLSSPAR
jgi:hypothetical protein